MIRDIQFKRLQAKIEKYGSCNIYVTRSLTQFSSALAGYLWKDIHIYLVYTYIVS